MTEVATKVRHPAAPKHLLPRVDTTTMHEASLAEYRAIAQEIGVSAQDVLVEEFRIFLAKHDIPTFNMAEVVKYMDEIVATDNASGFGWQWCPVRPKDAEVPMTWGRAARRDFGRHGSGTTTPASDFYESHQFMKWRGEGAGGIGQMAQGGVFYTGGGAGIVVMAGNGGIGNNHAVHIVSHVDAMQRAHDEAFNRPPQRPDWRTMPSPAYTRTIPLHALKKIALIEREFGAGKAVFLVTDYTTAPHVVTHPNPDPFLMAVIPNSAVAHGKGRFIIDVWDEPGFGIERMVK